MSMSWSHTGYTVIFDRVSSIPVKLIENYGTSKYKFNTPEENAVRCHDVPDIFPSHITILQR